MAVDEEVEDPGPIDLPGPCRSHWPTPAGPQGWGAGDSGSCQERTDARKAGPAFVRGFPIMLLGRGVVLTATRLGETGPPCSQHFKNSRNSGEDERWPWKSSLDEKGPWVGR